MAMNVGKGNGENEVMVEMNTTPLIDVMLVLLVMLIVTLPIQTHAVKLDMPNSKQPPPLITPVTHNIEVDFDGTILWDGAAVDFATLDAYFYNAGQQADSDQPEFHISANRLAKYDTVAKVMADAQRRGVKKIGIVGTENYVQ
jgi:biopolymer transport protein ExbD